MPPKTTPPTPPTGEEYQRSVESSLATLGQIDAMGLRELARLSAPELARLKREIAGAGRTSDLSGFLNHALTRLQTRNITRKRAERNLRAVFRGLGAVPQGVYGAFVAAPTYVLKAYQSLLRLTGRDVDSAFPEGTWQFYLQFALREDAARHTNETVAFQRALAGQVPEVMQAAAWGAAVARLVLGYDELLALVWQEQVSLRLLREIDEELGARAQKTWAAELPYRHPPGETYNAHRRRAFRALLVSHLAALTPEVRQAWAERYMERAGDQLAYQDQMSLLAMLTPGRHTEEKEPIASWRASVAVVHQGAYYLVPLIACDLRGRPLLFTRDGQIETLRVDAHGELRDLSGRLLSTDRAGAVFPAQGEQGGAGRTLGTLRPVSALDMLRQFAAIFTGDVPPAREPGADGLLVSLPRVEQAALRARWDAETRAEAQLLCRAPVILHWDFVAREQPLSELRRVRRGFGDHALTVIRTPSSMVFDQSHIFFDGTWGMAVAEILTNEARTCLDELLSAAPGGVRDALAASGMVSRPRRLDLRVTPALRDAVQALQSRVVQEVSAENDQLDLPRVQSARKALAQLGVRLTVNDLLILYRTLHTRWYVPLPQLQQEVSQLRIVLAEFGESRPLSAELETLLSGRFHANPALLIPMDASGVDPKERLFPATFRNPLLDLGERHLATYRALEVSMRTHTPESYSTFDALRRPYLAHLKAYGLLFEAFKNVTMRGEGFNQATIRLLAHLPPALQHALDQIPQKISVLNDVLKGEEVFSNVGRVAAGSSLVRFSSARDDGATKTLVWGVLTDDSGRVHVSLRDFRPHVAGLLRLGKSDLARRLAQDFLDEYVRGVNRFVDELAAIALGRMAEPAA